ncbi:EAL domain-containing protein [Azotobacter vinelandii]
MISAPAFSSLSNLINLPVTEVKIDRSFIDKCLEENRLQSLVAAVVGIGHSLDLTVVAEGVETREQRDLLGEYRCPVLQGYIFFAPNEPL